MKTIAEMIPEYESNLDALRLRRLELLELRKYEPHFEVRHQFTERIVAINKIIASSAAALEVMRRYGK